MAGKTLTAGIRPFQTLFKEGSFTGMTDDELLDRFLSGNDRHAEVAFAAIMCLHGPMVWNVCRGILSDPHDAEDAFQATFLILVRRAGSIRRRETVGPWLHGVARRVAVRAKAGNLRRRREEQNSAMKESSPPDPAWKERFETLHEEVGRLPEKYRSVIVLCHLEGRTHAQAARLLSCPVGTVSIRISRARELLRSRLTRRGLALSAILSGPAIAPATASMSSKLEETTLELALRVAAGKLVAAGSIPTAVAQLTKGESMTMAYIKSITITLGLAAAGATVWGLGMNGGRSQPRQANAAGSPVFGDPQQGQAPSDLKAQSLNNFKSLGLALNNYEMRKGSFPPAAIRGKDGKPLLSWRVAILPYIDEQALYSQFHLDEPWDSHHNKALLPRMPKLYGPLVPKEGLKDSTYYQVFVGPGTLFEDEKGTKLPSVTDGAAWTLAIVDGARAVPWTKPEDMPFDKEKPLPDLGGPFDDGFHGVFADGSALFFKKTLDPEILRAIITRNGGEAVAADALH